MRKRLRRIYSSTFQLRQSLKVAGVFLVILALVPLTAYAATLNGTETPAPGLKIKITLGQNQQKMKELDKTFAAKKEAIDKKLNTISEKQAQAKAVADQKAALANEVNDTKSQVEQLQAQVDAKKALEALHIMETGVYDYDADGNLYAPGNCTWYVKSLRPDIGNHWGDAHSWYASAAADGYKEGTVAKKGAIGVSFAGYLGHVVYVNSWNGDGTITISEMNYAGLYSTRTRLANEGDFVYIYQKP